MINYKKMISFLLVSVMLLSAMNINVFAQNLESEGKTNFNFISINDNGTTEYTYIENEKEYKVKEFSNEDLSEIFTDIYELNVNDQYILVSSYKTNVTTKKDVIEIKVTNNKDGSTTIDTINIDDIVTLTNSEKVSRAATNGWVHIYNYQGSVQFAKYTLSVIISVLGGAIGSLSGTTWVTGGVIAGISNIAEIILDKKIPYVYMKQAGYYYYNNGVPTKMKHITDCYEKSNGTGYIGTTTSEGTIIAGGN